MGPRDPDAAGRHPDELFGNGWHSLLGGPHVSDGGQVLVTRGVGLDAVGVRDGRSSTLRLVRKAMSPGRYGGRWGPGIPTGDAGGCAMPSGNSGHRRDPRRFTRDAGSPDAQALVGSPHPGSMPSPFAEGSVRAPDFGTAGDVIPRLWAWDDGGIVPVDRP